MFFITTTHRLSILICWLSKSACNWIIINSKSFTCHTQLILTYKVSQTILFVKNHSTSHKWHFMIKINTLHANTWISCRSIEIPHTAFVPLFFLNYNYSAFPSVASISYLILSKYFSFLNIFLQILLSSLSRIQHRSFTFMASFPLFISFTYLFSLLFNEFCAKCSW